ncbi:helix-turn-helix domain-containing protein [Aureimonas endophytica]|nr:hypothetical protein [Aureimonas endophytica]
MTPAEFKEARQTLGLSISQLARILDSAERSVRYWEDASSDRPLNPIAGRVMEWMLAGWRPPEWPDRLDPRSGTSRVKV